MKRTEEITPEYIEMFWEKVDIRGSDECWPWKMYTNVDGYGQVRLGNMQIASRVAYMITNGLIPLSIRVMHTCDNRICCNPNHLIAAPQKENILDMENKGRGKHTGKRTKFSESDIINIRKMWSEGFMAKDIAKKYNATPDVIYLIRMGRTYKKYGGIIDPINRHGGKRDGQEER